MRYKCIFQRITDGPLLVRKKSRHCAESNRSALKELASVSTIQVISNGNKRRYVYYVIIHGKNFLTIIDITTSFDIILFNEKRSTNNHL